MCPSLLEREKLKAELGVLIFFLLQEDALNYCFFSVRLSIIIEGYNALRWISPSMDEARKREIDELMQILGITPPGHEASYELYDRALTHSSYTYENKYSALDNYERMEFLGDAVLKLIVSEYLFERFPEYREGELTKIRAVIVSDSTLAQLSEESCIGQYMTFGASEARSGGRKKVSNLACGFEALLGALFLDGKMAEARNMLVEYLEDEVTKVDLNPTKDNYKAVLQELTQSVGDGLPFYRTSNESGPAHRKTFYVEVLVNDEVVGHGKGASKKEAQQSAAKMALEVMDALQEE